jgi:hypothetical protein
MIKEFSNEVNEVAVTTSFSCRSRDLGPEIQRIRTLLSSFGPY